MLANNVLSLVCNVLVSFLIYILSAYTITAFPNGVLGYVIGFILSILTIIIFTLIGRFILKDTGSIWKNVVSVVLPLMIGLYCAYSVATSAQAHQINLLVLYYGYCGAFINSLRFIGQFQTTLLFGIVFVSIPSVLFLFGLQWQSRNKFLK